MRSQFRIKVPAAIQLPRHATRSLGHPDGSPQIQELVFPLLVHGASAVLPRACVRRVLFREAAAPRAHGAIGSHLEGGEDVLFFTAT